MYTLLTVNLVFNVNVYFVAIFSTFFFWTNLSYSTEFAHLTSVCSTTTGRPLFKLFLEVQNKKPYFGVEDVNVVVKVSTTSVKTRANGVDSGQTWFVMFENNLKIKCISSKTKRRKLFTPAFGAVFDEFHLEQVMAVLVVVVVVGKGGVDAFLIYCICWTNWVQGDVTSHSTKVINTSNSFKVYLIFEGV